MKKVYFFLFALCFSLTFSPVFAGGLPMLKKSVSSGAEYAQALKKGDVNGGEKPVILTLYTNEYISEPTLEKAVAFLENLEIKACPQDGVKTLSNVTVTNGQGVVSYITRPYRKGEQCFYDRNMARIVGSTDCGNFEQQIVAQKPQTLTTCTTGACATPTKVITAPVAEIQVDDPKPVKITKYREVEIEVVDVPRYVYRTAEPAPQPRQVTRVVIPDVEVRKCTSCTTTFNGGRAIITDNDLRNMRSNCP